jgi:hypothetical protein
MKKDGEWAEFGKFSICRNGISARGSMENVFLVYGIMTSEVSDMKF